MDAKSAVQYRERLIVAMSRGFYRVVLCGFAARENGGTLIVAVKSICPVYR
jgi:hypothetical protein